MPRRRWFGGNWKLQKGVAASIALAQELRAALALYPTEHVDVVVIPSTVALYPVVQALRGSGIQVGAQDVFWESAGAWTGQTSPAHVAEVGCRFVLVGHSEKRGRGETPADVQRKVHAVRNQGLQPVICVGETQEEHAAGLVWEVIRMQVHTACEGLSAEQVAACLWAYEPVWAIGTGQAASPAWAERVHAFLRQELLFWGRSVAESARIVYGGSVSQQQVQSLMAQPNIDGALVGGASLTAPSFVDILNEAIQ